MDDRAKFSMLTDVKESLKAVSEPPSVGRCEYSDIEGGSLCSGLLLWALEARQSVRQAEMQRLVALSTLGRPGINDGLTGLKSDVSRPSLISGSCKNVISGKCHSPIPE